MAKTTIQWADYTMNPWRGCTKISPGCANCYAERWGIRQPDVFGKWGPEGTRVIAADHQWREPIYWNRMAERAGVRRRVFCASLADVFEERPELAEQRIRLFQLIGATPHLDWLLLTKRPEMAREHWPLFAGYWASRQDMKTKQKVAQDFVIPNVWLGTSVEDQTRADERIPHLLATPAKIHFLSVEPLLGPINLCANKMGIRPWNDEAWLGGIGWVIIGGESGPHARTCDLDWIRDIASQCQEAHIPYFVKQVGSNACEMTKCVTHDRKGGNSDEWPEDLRVRQFPNV